MSYQLYTSFIAFTLVALVTPGPNSLMLLTSGVNYGFRRTIPHILGIVLGFALMIFLVGVGLMQIFDIYPVTYDFLKVFSIAYLLYLAWKIAVSTSHCEAEKSAKPFTFLQAALFQWVNPKAWAIALAIISLYTPSRDLVFISIIFISFVVMGLPVVSFWALLGKQMQHILTNPIRLRTFNISMAAILVASLYPVIFF
ncbi:MAG: LysE family translocator [Sedimenticola sp.]